MDMIVLRALRCAVHVLLCQYIRIMFISLNSFISDELDIFILDVYRLKVRINLLRCWFEFPCIG